MSIRLGSVSRASAFVAPLTALLALVLMYLGLSPLTAVLAATSWVALGTAGGWLIEELIGGVLTRHRVLLALGPGPVLGLGLAVFIYLSVRGGPLGLVTIIALVLGATLLWWRSVGDLRAPSTSTHFAVVMLGSALLANSKEFPNLLATSVALLTAVLVSSVSKQLLWRAVSVAAVVGVLAHDVVTRPSYWWWSSDDTTTLSGIGTMIIERGVVTDVAGWSTTAHHWLLHAWLALWNLLSFGQIFETYLIAWPLVASVSMFASLWLSVELLLKRSVGVPIFVFVSTVTAGLVRLDWSAPQEQQPFLFAMIASSALWFNARERCVQRGMLRTVVGALFLLAIIPAVLFVLKPSLLVAYSLLLLGTGLVHFGYGSGRRTFIAAAISLVAVFGGLFVLRVGDSWITSRSFTSFGVRWFPRDLGWCSEASMAGSLACVLSLQVVLFVGAALSVVVLSALRPSSAERVSLVVLLPLVMAYLPLRYFISSGVGSGAPSFYRLSEMTLMAVMALAIAIVLSENRIQLRAVVVLVAIAAAITLVSRGPSEIYDRVDLLLVSVSFLRYLNPADVLALCLAAVTATLVTRTRLLTNTSEMRYGGLALGALLLVSLLPVARLVTDSATSKIDSTRLSRPADFGPGDIEEVGDWIRQNTEPGTLLATNYLCPENRLSECSKPPTVVECPRTEPALMASWALTALSHREFYYLSQMWDLHSSFYLEHMTSTRLGNALSRLAITDLKDVGVTYYVASRDHTNPQVWLRLLDSSELQTEHFAVVSLKKLETQVIN